MKIRKNDKIIVIRGKDKGKTGLVLQTLPNKNQIIVDGLNQVKKHQKGEAKGKGEMITLTKAMDVSKVMLIDPSTNKPTRVGYIIEDGKKYRIAKKSGIKLETIRVSKKNEASETTIKELESKNETKKKTKKSTTKKTKKSEK